MSTRSSILAGALLLALPVSASAQKFTDVAQQLDIPDAPARRPSPGLPVRVQVSYQLQIPAAHTLSIEEQAQSISSSHEAMYQLAAHECEHLQALARGECRMVSLNIGNANMSYGQQAGFAQVTGNATFDIVPRPVSPASAAPPAMPDGKAAPADAKPNSNDITQP